VAKKNPKNLERRELVEKMRQDQARKERARSLGILGVCVLIVVALIGTAVVTYVKDKNAKDKAAATPVADLGVAATAAACDDVITKEPSGADRSGATGSHVTIGTPITYKDGPPAYGQHWPNFLNSTEIRNFYSLSDRPEVQRMVHSLEHGHTLIWYDETVTPGSDAYKHLEAISAKYQATTAYVNVLPWKSTDGAAFPEGKHVALTHWAAEGDTQTGVWQYCAQPSGEVIQEFVKDYPNTNSPEPGAP